MALSSLSCPVSFLLNWTATRAITGIAAQSNSTQAQKSLSFTTGAGALAGNLLSAGIVSLAGGANTSLDLTSIADVTGTTVTFARLKAAAFWLLAAGDTAPDGSTAGTAASSVTIGNGTNPLKMFLHAGTDELDLNNGAFVCWADPGATGIVVDGTDKTVKFLNNDGSVTAKVWYAFMGAES